MQLLPVCKSWEDYLWAFFKVMVDVRVEQVIVFLFVLFLFLVSLIGSWIWNFKGSKVDQEIRELVVANVNVLGWLYGFWLSDPLCKVAFPCYSDHSPTCMPKINLNFYFIFSVFFWFCCGGQSFSALSTSFINIMWTADIQMKWRCDHRSCVCDLSNRN